ncbi:hypothetical protein TNCV_3114011 [Trichonephila clavipes]|nr:hypothetical protein TNCV_3114011 [Trichonephila clavipes]
MNSESDVEIDDETPNQTVTLLNALHCLCGKREDIPHAARLCFDFFIVTRGEPQGIPCGTPGYPVEHNLKTTDLNQVNTAILVTMYQWNGQKRAWAMKVFSKNIDNLETAH